MTQIRYRLVDENNQPLSTTDIPPYVSIPSEIASSKLIPGKGDQEDVLELTIEVKTEAKYIYTNKDRKRMRRQ